MAAAAPAQPCPGARQAQPCPATHIVLRNRDGEPTQHDGLAFFFIVNIVPVVVLAVVAIGMVSVL